MRSEVVHIHAVYAGSAICHVAHLRALATVAVYNPKDLRALLEAQGLDSTLPRMCKTCADIFTKGFVDE